jgi:hypothetical protein
MLNFLKRIDMLYIVKRIDIFERGTISIISYSSHQLFGFLMIYFELVDSVRYFFGYLYDLIVGTEISILFNATRPYFLYKFSWILLIYCEKI